MSNPTPKIIFFGTPDFAVPFLDALVAGGFKPAAVITAPDKAAGRKQVLTPPSVKEAALRHGIPVYQPATLKDEDFFKTFTELAPDVCVVVAYGKIFPDKYLSLPRFGFLNVHPSLLPKYRGPSPIQSAILNGDAETGVSIMLLDKDIDHGPVLSNVKYKMANDEYYPALRDTLTELGVRLLMETIPKYLSGEVKPMEQDHPQATFTKMLTREDGKLDWSKTAQELTNRVRALNPEPGTWATWGGKVLNILAAHPLPYCLPEHPPVGTVSKIEKNIAVHVGECPLVLERVQLEGGKAMSIADFVNGHPDFVGSVLE